MIRDRDMTFSDETFHTSCVKLLAGNERRTQTWYLIYESRVTAESPFRAVVWLNLCMTFMYNTRARRFVSLHLYSRVERGIVKGFSPRNTAQTNKKAGLSRLNIFKFIRPITLKR